MGFSLLQAVDQWLKAKKVIERVESAGRAIATSASKACQAISNGVKSAGDTLVRIAENATRYISNVANLIDHRLALIAKNKTVKLILRYAKNPVVIGAVVVALVGIALAPLLAPPLLGAVGFSAGGVVAGSAAAAIQATIGNVVAGSLFAGAQAVAMGASLPAIGYIGAAVVGGLLGGMTGEVVVKFVKAALFFLRQFFL